MYIMYMYMYHVRSQYDERLLSPVSSISPHS